MWISCLVDASFSDHKEPKFIKSRAQIFKSFKKSKLYFTRKLGLPHCKVNLTYLSKHKVWKMIKSTRFFFRYLALKYMYAHQKLRLNRIEYCNIWCSSCFIGLIYLPDNVYYFFILLRPKLKMDFYVLRLTQQISPYRILFSTVWFWFLQKLIVHVIL